MALFTGARRGNVQAMEWKAVDLDFKLWQIPEAKGGKPVLVPLAPEVVELLRQRQEASNGPWVFPSNRQPWKPVQDVRRAWARILERAQIEDLHIHDLRRTRGVLVARETRWTAD